MVCMLRPINHKPDDRPIVGVRKRKKVSVADTFFGFGL